MVKCGVIGLGTNGTMHFKQLELMKDVEIIGVADPNLTVCEAKLDLTRIPHRYTDYNDLMDIDGLEAVFIFSPSGNHIEHIKAAITRKLDIFCEKPLGKDESVEECQAVLDEAATAGVKLQIGFNRRFDPQFKDIHDRVANGAVGTPQIVKVTARDPFVIPYDFIKNSGGLIQDFTAHDFDMVRYQSGSDITEIYLQASVLIDDHLKELGDVDTLTASCKLANGGFALIDESRKAVYGYDQRVEVFGEKGMLKAENVNQSTVEYYNDTDVSLKKPLDYYLNRFKEAYIYEKESFIHSVKTNSPVICSGEDALKSMKCCIAAQKSLETGKPVMVEA